MIAIEFASKPPTTSEIINNKQIDETITNFLITFELSCLTFYLCLLMTFKSFI